MKIDTEQIDVEELQETARQLPPLPRTTSRIVEILGDPMFEVSELIKIIALDPPLTASLLRIANSAAYARARPAASVGEAIVRLGSGTILALAIAGSARPDADIDLSAFGLTVEDYWRRSVGTVAAAEELTARRVARFGSGFSTAALLHDFGKLILASHITTERAGQLAEFAASNPGHRPVDAERTVLGADHAVAGAVVARHWNLPDAIVTTIEKHHSPVAWEDELTNGVIVADQIAMENGEHSEFTLDTAENVANAMLALGIDDGMYEDVARSSQIRFEMLIELFAA